MATLSLKYIGVSRVSQRAGSIVCNRLAGEICFDSTRSVHYSRDPWRGSHAPKLETGWGPGRIADGRAAADGLPAHLPEVRERRTLQGAQRGLRAGAVRGVRGG